MKTRYSKQKLLNLLQNSAAYAGLPAEQQQQIQAHLAADNKQTAKFIFYTLLEEQQKYDHLAQKLGQQLEKIVEKQTQKLIQTVK